MQRSWCVAHHKDHRAGAGSATQVPSAIDLALLQVLWLLLPCPVLAVPDRAARLLWSSLVPRSTASRVDINTDGSAFVYYSLEFCSLWFPCWSRQSGLERKIACSMLSSPDVAQSKCVL